MIDRLNKQYTKLLWEVAAKFIVQILGIIELSVSRNFFTQFFDEGDIDDTTHVTEEPQ